MSDRKCFDFFVVMFIAILLLCTSNDKALASIQCYDCHGTKATGDNRPEDAPFRNSSSGGFQGNHQKHLGPGATPGSCQKCHPGSSRYQSSHRDGTIKLSYNINSSAHPSKARYINSTSSGYSNFTSFPQTSDKSGRFVLGSCSNVNCHFESSTPVWGSDAFTAPADCNRCHGIPPSGGVTGGAAGSHARHADYYSGVSQCIKCHTGHTSFEHATSAGRRVLIVKPKDPLNIPGGSYSGQTNDYLPSQNNSFGSCSELYCHSNAGPFDNTSTAATPLWGSGQQTCSSCHGTSGLSRRHAKHIGATYTFSCDRCHNDTATDSNTIKSTVLHVNKSKDVTFKEGGMYAADKGCTTTYCHSNAAGGAPGKAVKWSDTTVTMTCYSCHKGRTQDSTSENCTKILGVWSSAKGSCTPDLTMSSNGHHRLVGSQWIRKYPCYYCHNNTVDTAGTVKDPALHFNKVIDVSMAPQWNIDGRAPASYNPATKVCNNVYCHSDGTANPEDVRPFAWTEPKTECNTCHGHPTGSCANAGCHDGKVHANDPTGKVWPLKTGWPVGSEWMGSMPMFPNQGAGNPRANSHPRHAQTNFTCDQCHNKTIRGDCSSCHAAGIPPGGMGEVAHIDAFYHVDTKKNVDFKDMPSAVYDKDAKTCSATTCHPVGDDPVWGGSVNSSVTCLSCHGIAGSDSGSNDVNDYNAFNGTQGKIDKKEWVTTGHGRISSVTNTGSYPKSGNPAAKFPGNPCWYCHDNNVLHKDSDNIYRLKKHSQYEQRFEKECVYCHMTWTNAECLACHVNQTESLSPQATSGGIVYKFQNSSTETRYTGHTYVANCINGTGCHDSDSGTFADGKHKGHNSGSGAWTSEMKADVKNQYLMMGVCLQCHDDDSSNQCVSCHIAPQSNPLKYSLGYDPGTGFIKPSKARASAGHFGYKHYRSFKNSGGWTKIQSTVKSPNFKTYSVAMGTWKGGKFCWDCHDPHGDSNIYMIQKKVSTETDGWFGVPKPDKQKDVVFTGVGGADYVKKSGTGVVIDGICNVCHSPDSKHYTSEKGDGHNYTRRCTSCHEHRFADSHANKKDCNSCHKSSKPIPKHTAFGLPRDCTKCHSGTVGRRMDIMGQLKSNSHHVQGVEVNNKHCYACHWEATSDGLIDNQRHTGYNYKNYSSVKDDVVDLVIWKANGVRPTFYSSTSVTTFLAKNMVTDGNLQRSEVSKISNHCLSCHSDQNNDSDPFGDCKTPRQYAWDLQSVASRYVQLGIATWGKYTGTPKAAQKNITKSFSAHGNAVANGGGWSATTGLDGIITDTRGGASNKNVQCFDCHNSHGSKVVGITSSYVTFNGTNNGANLKETRKDMGGYTADYKASSNTSGVNPYGAGAGQCFDCHNTANAGSAVPSGKTPWGYNSTFGASAPIMGYRDTPMFGQGTKGFITKNNATSWLDSRKTILGGHMKASTPTGQPNENLAKDLGAASGGSKSTLVDSGKTWIESKWRNLYLLMGSGSNSGQIRKITGNTTTTLTVEAFNSAIVAGDSYKIVPYSATVNGLCSGCHDPHGVSTTLSNQAYGVPLLKGTWVTSPYKEDSPPVYPTGPGVTNGINGMPRSWGRYARVHPTAPNEPSTNYNLDRTTFGGSTRISEKDDLFAGVCMNCHKKETLTDGVNKNQNFKTVDRIHESVKGWGVNSEHSFTCSKCHQPHSSGLPRLMQTNCLDNKHRGSRASGGEYWSADQQHNYPHGYGEHRGYPIGSTLGVRYASPEATTSCHAGAPANTGSWPANNYWNEVTRW